MTATKGSAISSNSPTVTGGDVVSWSISPYPPTGLSMSTATGVISGTPSVVAASTSHTVTATNSGGSDTFDVTIVVNDGEYRSVPLVPFTLSSYLRQ